MTRPDARVNPSLGITVFSLSDVWRLGIAGISTDGLLAAIDAAGVGPDLEMIGFQSFRGFPGRDPAADRAFRDLADRHGLRPTALGVYADILLDGCAAMDVDRSVDYLLPQLRAASALGFPLVRTSTGFPPALIERLEPHLKQLGVTLTIEVQGTTDPAGEAIAETLQCLDRIGSEYLGVVLDFSLVTPAVPATLRRFLSEQAIPVPILNELDTALTGSGTAFERFEPFSTAARAASVPEHLIGRIFNVFIRLGRSRTTDWAFMMPWVRHVHAKYWDLDDSLGQVTVPHRGFLKLLQDNNYQGSISSEWGGSDWLEPDQVDIFEQTRRHQRLIRATLADPGAAEPPSPTDSSR